jgi:hypothetical protein
VVPADRYGGCDDEGVVRQAYLGRAGDTTAQEGKEVTQVRSWDVTLSLSHKTGHHIVFVSHKNVTNEYETSIIVSVEAETSQEAERLAMESFEFTVDDIQEVRT